MTRALSVLAIVGAVAMSTMAPAEAKARATSARLQSSSESVFYITGHIRNSGSYRFEPDMNVDRALLVGGGITSSGDEQRITIARIVEGKRVKVRVSIDDVVLPNDLIQIGSRP